MFYILIYVCMCIYVCVYIYIYICTNVCTHPKNICVYSLEIANNNIKHCKKITDT